MVSVMLSALVQGVNAMVVKVECDKTQGLPGITIIGLADTVVKEAAMRTKLAIKNSGFKLSKSKMTINVVPADIKKEGSHLDLPIALSLLKCELDKTPEGAEDIAAIGEVNLHGDVLPVRGALALLIALQEEGVDRVIIPKANLKQAKLLSGIRVYPVENLESAYAVLLGNNPFYEDCRADYEKSPCNYEDFSEVCGQMEAKRALEIACAGGHNVLMMGPPGSGKSMLSKRIPGILPDLSYSEVLELTKIYSVSKQPVLGDVITRRPFRSPHHGASAVALCGGGKDLSPGEISLAHRGVLFLDELPEFSRSFIESIRQPIEDKVIHISRASGQVTYPANFILVAAFNPCPCGYYGDREKPCTCTQQAIRSYQNRISGPILDRFDIQIIVPRIAYEDLRKTAKSESSEIIKARVEQVRELQYKRFKDGMKLNGTMQPKEIKKYCKLDAASEAMIEKAYKEFGFSVRCLNSVIKLARTISDLKGLKNIDKSSVLEALAYRRIDRLFQR